MPEEEKIKFSIITPERKVFEDVVDSVSLPTKNGEITILPHHIPLISTIIPGEVKIRKGEEEIPLVVAGGFVEVKGSSEVIVLADAAERVEEIDIERAEQARRRAEQLMREKAYDKVTFTEASAALQRALARLKVASKYRRHTYIKGSGVVKDEE